MNLANKLLITLRDYWIFPVALIGCISVICVVTMNLPAVSPECLKPTTLCEVSPLPLLAGLGTIVSAFFLYSITMPTQSQDGKLEDKK